jgi:hypothetical protein
MSTTTTVSITGYCVIKSDAFWKQLKKKLLLRSKSTTANILPSFAVTLYKQYSTGVYCCQPKKSPRRMRAVLRGQFGMEREGISSFPNVCGWMRAVLPHCSTDQRSSMLDASQCSLHSFPNVRGMLRPGRRLSILYAMTAHVVASY